MLNYRILSAKKTITKKSDFDGTESVTCVVLLIDTTNKYTNSFLFNICNVTKDYIARPDLISLAFYKTDEYADIICKINGISNPFELNEGYVLVIPDISALNSIIKSGTKSQIVDDASEIVGSLKHSNQKLKSDTRSPGEQTVGDKNYIIDRTNRLIYY